MNITILNTNGDILEYKDFIFPGGEIGLKLEADNFRFFANNQRHFRVIARIANSNDLIALAMVKNALENIVVRPCIDLVLPYVPYARQDRICDGGEAFSLKVLADFINHLNFNTVKILDPHSGVAPALLNNVTVVTQLEIIHRFEEFKKFVLGGAVFVAPDGGAIKKTSDLAGYFNHIDFIRADKLRDLSNGKIKETVVYADDLTGANVVIADDICDGGRTFIELAKVLKAKNAAKVILYVTHGIFSQGFEKLYQEGIDQIFTTNSFREQHLGYYPQGPELVTLDIKTLI